MTEKMSEILDELIHLQREIEEELPKPFMRKMDTITGKFENLMIAVKDYEKSKSWNQQG